MKSKNKLTNKLICTILFLLVFYASIKLSQILNFSNSKFEYSISIMLFTYIQYTALKYVNKNVNKLTKFQNIVLVLYTIILSVIMAYAKEVNGIYENGSSYFLTVNLKRRILDFMGLEIFFYIVLKAIIILLLYNTSKVYISNSKKKKVFTFFLVWILIFVMWIPYFLALYPAVLSPDSISQYAQATGINTLSNHHPIVTTLILKLCTIVTNTAMHAIALYAIIQMLIMSLVFTYTLKVLSKTNINKIFVFVTFLYFAINPMHAMYSCTIWKDVYYGVAVLLFATQLLNIHLNNFENMKNIGQNIIFLLSIVLVGIIRSNGFLVILAMFPFFICVSWKHKKQIFVFLAGIILAYFIKSPLCKILNVTQPHFAETIGYPLRQIAEVIVKDKNIDTKDLKFINNILEIKEIKKVYTPMTSDSIKFNKGFNHEFLESHKGEFIKLWIKLGIEYPGTYLESYIKATNCFWNPVGCDAWFYVEIYKNNLGIKANSRLPQLLKELETIHYKLSEKPIVGLLYNYGFIIWIVLYAIIINMYRKNYTVALACSTVFLNWGTLMVASPVARQLRYIYSLYTVLPIIMLAIIYDIKRKDEIKCLK